MSTLVSVQEGRAPIALTVAGSDSGGGAGIQADLKTFHAFGVFGTSVITAVTAQNTRGVLDAERVSPKLVATQIRALREDLAPNAWKSGMLVDTEIVDTVAHSIREMPPLLYVLDPVMVATSGDRLLAEEAERRIVEALVPTCTVITPNIPEARALTGLDVEDEASMRRAGLALIEMGAGAALVKGGHAEGGSEIVDLLVRPFSVRAFRHPRIDTRNTHGTGCTLSAAITAGLALGRPLETAVEGAIDFVRRAISSAPGLGSGHGPLNHDLEPHGK